MGHAHGGMRPPYRGRPHRPQAGHATHIAAPTGLTGRALGAVTMAAASTAAELTTAHREREEAEPNPVVHRELEVSVLLVVVGFVVLLRLFQAVTDLREELITLH
jgi:hypothetical protein